MDITRLWNGEKTPTVTTTVVTIGLDFGTSSSKVMVNIHGETPTKDKIYAFAFQTEDDTFNFLFPSVVGVDNNKVVTGFLAENVAGAYESFKMWLPKLVGVFGFGDAILHRFENDIFWLGEDAVSAKELSIIHLTEVLRRVIDGLIQLDKNTKYKVHLNLACPLGPVLLNNEDEEGDQDAADAIKEKYIDLVHEIGFRALKLVKHAKRNVDVDEVIQILDEQEQNLRVIKRGETGVSVVAEAHAAVISYIMHPSIGKGRYFTVDIGAGTTDSAMFWLKKNTMSSVDDATYYSFETGYYGMDDIDSILFNNVDTSLSPRQYREKRGLMLTDRDAILVPLDKMWKTYQTVFGKAYEKEMRASLWHDEGMASFKLLLLGGGSEQSIIQEEFQRSDRTPWRGQINSWDVNSLEAKHKREILLEDGTLKKDGEIGKEYENKRPFLVVAEGLAYRALAAPPWNIQIEPVPINIAPPTTLPTHEDLYDQ